VLEGDEEVGEFVWPPGEEVRRRRPRLDEILGAREPAAVLARLGIAPSLLGRS
jgi:hypothetical protein